MIEAYRAALVVLDLYIVGREVEREFNRRATIREWQLDPANRPRVAASARTWRAKNLDRVRAYPSRQSKAVPRSGVCAACGEPFTTFQPLRRYCSNRCKLRAFKARRA